jgi:hypothetical protein
MNLSLELQQLVTLFVAILVTWAIFRPKGNGL